MAVVLLAVSIVLFVKRALGANCNNGCLVCNKNDICMLCDTANFYVRSGYTCVRRVIENCEYTIDGQKCLRCKSPFYADPKLNTCVKATANITSCLEYKNATTCGTCDASKYVDSNGLCAAIDKDIARCAKYKDATHCAVCAKSQLNSDGTACNSPPLVDNCAFYSGSASCTECVNGMYLNMNKYLIDMQTDPNFLKAMYNFTVEANVTQTYLANYKTNICIKKNRNCADLKDYNNCTACNASYYLFSGRCVGNPVEAISKCKTYASEKICTACFQGYYLASPTSCVQQKGIEFCSEYSGTQQNVCSQCENGYFFNETIGRCVSRTLQIKNCAVWVWNKELCAGCKESYLLAPNQAECFSTILKCNSYLFLSAGNSGYNLICNRCLPGFFIKTTIEGSLIKTVCSLPTTLIEGCQEYQSNTLCDSCQNNYFLANFRCHHHELAITSKLACKAYSTETMNTCSTCETLEFLYQIYNYCENVGTKIDNCAEYNSTQHCVKCVSPYYLTVDSFSSQVCQKTNIVNCQEVDTTTNMCTACDMSQNLVPSDSKVNNACVKIPTYINAGCENLVVSIAPFALYCNGCTAPYYPKNYTDARYQFCVADIELADFKSKLSVQDIQNLANCDSFDFATKACLICDQKSDTPYIASDTKLCRNTCNFEDEVILTFDFVGISPNSYFACKGISTIHMWGENTENCRRVDYDVSYQRAKPEEKNIEQWCAECKEGFIPLTATTSSYNFTHYDYQPLKHLTVSIAGNSYFSHAIKKPLFFSCISWQPQTMYVKASPFLDLTFKKADGAYVDFYKAGSNYFVQNWIKFDSCRVVVQFKTPMTEYYGCGACKFGYTGIVITGTDGNSFVHSCTKMTECDTSYYYSGVGSHSPNAMLDFYVSCHVCLDSNRIVTITDRKPWSMVNLDTQTLQANFGTNGYYPYITCYPRGLTASNGAGFPDKCMVQQLIPSKKLQYYTVDFVNPPNPACIACAPGYFPKISDTNIQDTSYPYIKSCEKIVHCKSSNTFNVCEVCDANYVLEYSNVRGLTTGYVCVANSMVGCLVGEENGKCYKCATGYILNMEGICDDAQLQKCATAGTMTPLPSAYDYLTTNPFGQGCLKCVEQRYSVRFDFMPITCAYNMALSQTSFGQRHLVANCQQYGYDLKKGLQCNTCNSGFYMTDDKKLCIKEKIPFCLTYAVRPNNEFVCVKCQNFYYLNQAGGCSEGQIKGCKEYTNNQNCRACNDNHMATRINLNQYTICMNITSSISNCLNIDVNSGLAGILNCLRCSSLTYPKAFDIPVKTCAKFYPIENCLAYDLRDTFSTSTFFCLNCTEPYYVTANEFPSICHHRINYPINNCLKYNINTDICDQCIENFFLSSDKLSCQPNPAGIQGCRVYSSFSECSECKEGYYPFNKTCLSVPSDKVANGCYTYTKDIACSKCAKGFTMKSSSCVTADIQNCGTPGFDGQCEVCISGYQLIGTSCAKASLANCAQYESTTSCKNCETGYYLVSGRCFAPTAIDNCRDYDSKTTCTRCQDGFLIDNSRTKCNLLTGPLTEYKNAGCAVFKEINSCVICDAGHYFSGSTCSPCQTTRAECRYCDYVNTTQCIMCESGYHMTVNLACVKDSNATIASNASRLEDLNADYFIDKSQRTVCVGLLWALMLLLSII